MKKLIIPIFAGFLIGCGGNSTNSGGGGGSQGPTPHVGEWQLIASVAITVGDAANNFTHTSNVLVNPDGLAIVKSTDSDCSVAVKASGNVLSYEERCSFNSGCVVTFATQAQIFENNLSAPFGPERFVCSGQATSYSGNLIGSKVEERELSFVKNGAFNDEDGDATADAGETISYTFRLTNDGNLPLSNLSVTDPIVPTITCPSGNPMVSLAVGAVEICTGTYTITAADITAGQRANTATATSDETGPVESSKTIALP